MTNSAGERIAEYKYDAWGNITNQWGTTGTGSEIVTLNPYRYAGYWYDTATSKYYLKARYYDAEIGRFLSKDPVTIRLGDHLSLNAYTYAGNTPVMMVDPSGEDQNDINFAQGPPVPLYWIRSVSTGGQRITVTYIKGMGRNYRVYNYTKGAGSGAQKGEFSISNWNGYPSNGPKPQGPFRLLKGQEYTNSRKAANNANKYLHRVDPSLRGKQIHEIQPVKFGGSPTDLSNKIPLTPKQHAVYTRYWNNLLRNIQRLN